MRLFLMRHATAESGEGKEDFARILTPSGEEEAKKAGHFLSNYQIDKLLVSYVKRTMQTSSLIQKEVMIAELEITEELYQASEEEIIDLIAKQEDRNKHLLVIGHNPSIYRIALELSDENSSKYDFLVSTSMPPARIVVIDFPDMPEWSNLKKHKGKIIKIFTSEGF
jgi:phosphohistidine phosphatase